MGADLSKADMGGYTFIGLLAAPRFGVAVESRRSRRVLWLFISLF